MTGSLRKAVHWTDMLFVKHPELFLPWMKEMRSVAGVQAKGLQKIFEEHGVSQGARILDLQSGIGRISIHLAKIGYEVVGTDILPLYLREAEKWAAEEKLDHRVRFYRLDSREAARELRKKEKRFDAVINIDTAMDITEKMQISEHSLLSAR
jgi:cyclopropane fatty-acyl-phospholipid synthase-like methyltransferase